MMPILRSSGNNDQNINRLCTKMSEEFSGQTNAKLLNCADNVKFYNNKLGSPEFDKDELNLSYDHMYASNTENENSEVTAASEHNCQSTDSEVRFLKEWLILHLDLIQQQNDEILDKENSILILQRENEMLKERIRCMEEGTPFLLSNHFNSLTNQQFLETSSTEDMTQDSGPCDEDNKDRIELINLNYLNGNNCSVELVKLESDNILSEISTENKTVNKENESLIINKVVEASVNEHTISFVNNSDTLTESDNIVECKTSDLSSFPVNNSSDFDPMRNLRMSIRRKRVCSNSSAVSNNGSTVEEKRHYRRFRKKKKRVLKDSQVLTTPEQYVTHAGETTLGLSSDSDPLIPPNKTLEVPRWRVKVYASCYTMEGTENLDDEVYVKRHSRFEIDERRRKRWDVQRIREQRVIEKLKLRHEKAAASSKNDETGESVNSFWPKAEDIKFLEVCDQLPVCAFGYPIPKISPCEFSLPWMNNPDTLAKKVPVKRSSTAKRKSSTKR